MGYKFNYRVNKLISWSSLNVWRNKKNISPFRGSLHRPSYNKLIFFKFDDVKSFIDSIPSLGARVENASAWQPLPSTSLRHDTSNSRAATTRPLTQRHPIPADQLVIGSLPFRMPTYHIELLAKQVCLRSSNIFDMLWYYCMIISFLYLSFFVNIGLPCMVYLKTWQDKQKSFSFPGCLIIFCNNNKLINLWLYVMSSEFSCRYALHR